MQEPRGTRLGRNVRKYGMMHRYHRTEELLEAEIGDELVALNVTAGTCFGFNSFATFVWQLLERDRSFDELMPNRSRNTKLARLNVHRSFEPA